MLFKKKTEKDCIKKANKKIRKLTIQKQLIEKKHKDSIYIPNEERDKDEKKLIKLENKINEQKEERKRAYKELNRPVSNQTINNTQINPQVSFNKNEYKKALEFHGHYHSSKSKKRK